MKHSIDRLSRTAEDMFQLSVDNRCNFKLKLEQTDLSACVDELGATIFFHLVSARYERGSVKRAA